MLNCPHCEYEFEDVSQDQISIYNAKTRILSIKCPECTKNFRINREESDKLIEKYPDLEKEMEQVKIEKANKSAEPEDVKVGDFEDKFRDALSIFGLNSKKYEPKIQAVLKLIERTGATRDWLKYHLQRFSFTNRPTIDSIVDIVFLDDADQVNMPPYPMPGGNQVSGYTTQVLPGGQVILMPSAPQAQYSSPAQPIIIDRGRDTGDRVVKVGDNENITIEELDDEGKVKKRIIKGRTAQPVPDSKPTDSTRETLLLLKELGLIQSPQPHTEQQTVKLPDEIKATLDSLNEGVAHLIVSGRDGSHKTENEDLKKMTEKFDVLTKQIETLEKEKKENEARELKQQLSDMKEQIKSIAENRNRGESDTTPHGMSDTQFGSHIQHKNLVTMTDTGEHLVSKLVDPLNKILDNQTKLNSLLTVINLEKQDGVAPGTYMKALQPAPIPSDAEVKGTVKRWQEKAAGAGAAQAAGGAAK